MFDSRGRVLQYDESQTGDGLGGERRIERRNMAHDDRSRVTGYEETVYDPDGLKTETRAKDIVYNPLAQELGRTETINVSQTKNGQTYTLTTERERRQSRYNRYGQLQAYLDIETSSDSKVEKRTLWSRGTYDTKGRLATFRERTVQKGALETGEMVALETETLRDETLYDARGLLEKMKETTFRSDLPASGTQKIQSNTRYDTLGRVDTYELEENDFARINSQDYLKSRTITRNGTSYDLFGRQLGYSEKIVTSGEDGVNRLALEETVVNNNRTYGAGRVLLHYDETRSTSAETGRSSQLSWTATSVSDQGRVLAQKEERMTGEKQTENTRTAMTYDDLGRLRSYKENVTDSTRGKIGATVDWAGTYDDQNRSTGFQETRHETGPGFDLTTTRNRNNITYDAFSRLASYDETGTDGKGISTSSHWTGGYNGLNQLVSFSQLETRTGKLYDVTRTIERANTVYDLHDRLVGYRESVNGNDAPDLTIQTTVSNSEFDANGQAQKKVTHEEKQDRQGKVLNARDVVRENAKYDGQDRILSFDEVDTSGDGPDEARHTQRVSTQYSDNTGLETKRTDTNYVKVGAQQSDNVTVVAELGYDGWGRENATTTVENRGGSITTTLRTVSGFTADGQAKNFDETQTVTGLGQSVERTKNRTSTYDQKGHLTFYKDQTWTNETPDLETTFDWSTPAYDRMGRITGFTEHTKSVATKLPHPPLRGTFSQEEKENKDFPSPLGRLVAELPAPGAPEALMRGQGEGSEELRYSMETTRTRTDINYSGFDRLNAYKDTNTNLSTGVEEKTNRTSDLLQQPGPCGGLQRDDHGHGTPGCDYRHKRGPVPSNPRPGRKRDRLYGGPKIR
ncbi:MAG: hypothetical protein IPN19_01930 [Elusimicrobia bacterium]|nr:hypothetical protein [Elusimicrobiota bacterium]